MSFSIGESPIEEHLKSSQLKVLDEVTKAELNQAIISDVRLTEAERTIVSSEPKHTLNNDNKQQTTLPIDIKKR